MQQARISILQRVKLSIYGYCFLRWEKRDGWSGYLPIYLLKCEKHGFFEDYPHGIDVHFHCPKCSEEIRRSFNELVREQLPTVTTVVCAHNEQDHIEGCLQSIIEQSVNPTHVIVVLDRCTDETLRIVKEYPVEVIEKPVRSWENSYAENLELARWKAEGQYFAIVDADVTLDRDYFEKTLSSFSDKTVAVSGRMITASPGLLGKIIRLWERTYYYSPFKTRLPAGCALLVRKSFLDEIGGFKDLPAPDTYLHQRALERGLDLLFVKDTKVYHRRKLTLRRVIHAQIDYGKRRRRHGISFWKTVLHAAFRMRPFVLYGWLAS